MDLESPDHEDELRKIRSNAMLTAMMTDPDDPISGHDPARVAEAYNEIAQTLRIEVGTVKSRIARARGLLRSLMAESCPEFGVDALPVDWFEANRPSGALRAAAA